MNRVPRADLANILTTLVTEQFVKILQTEVHEKVLCHALEMFSLWSTNYTGQLPNKIIDTFKSGLELKSVTQNVRVAYLQWLLACLEHATLPAGVDLTAALIKTIEKASQNATQIPLVSEAVCAVCLLLKTETDGAKLSNFWNIVTDMQKQVFVSEKFITSAPADTLCYVALMCKHLLLEHASKLRGDEPLYRAIVAALTTTSKKVRTYSRTLIADLIARSGDNTMVVITNLLQQLTNLVQSLPASDDETSQQSQAFFDAIQTITTSTTVSSRDGQTVALNSLLCANHPIVAATASNFWENIVRQLELEPKSLISLNLKHIRGEIIEKYKPQPMYKNAVASIVRLCPDILLPVIVERVTNELNVPALASVTDDEYFTFLTPDGELYDKSVIPNTEDIYKDLSKRRENKVYSYKEQLEEIQLRREIEEKKRKDGTWKPPKLTPKQQEAIKNQTEKENAIKRHLTELNNMLNAAVSLIQAALSGNAVQLQLHFAELLPRILQLLKSPLAAESLTKLYYELRSRGDDDHSLGELMHSVAITTLRLHEPHCDLPEEWTKATIGEQIESTLDALAVRTEEEDGLVTAPTFCYVFEFLKKALTNKTITSNEDRLLQTIHIIAKHVRVPGDTADGDLTDYKHPKYLPRYQILVTLLHLISSHRGRVQSQAVSAVLDVAKSSSGEAYCARGDRREIECLLNALQSNLDVVRDVGLRALDIMVNVLPDVMSDYDFNLYVTRRLWVAKHDISEENKELADKLWEKANLDVPIVMSDELLRDVVHSELCIQKAAAAALVSILREDNSLVDGILAQLLEIYNEKTKMIPAQLDQFEREIVPAIDQWVPRRGVAIALCQIAQFYSLESVDKVIQFMVSKGLGDRDEIVHKEMLAAALAVVDLHGKETTNKLLPVFENFLDKAPKSSTYDNIRQAVVILMGSLARHLDKDDERIQPIVRRLLAALSTPSQQVQEAVANCLPHLMPSVKDEANGIIKKLLNQLVKSDKYAERRGAAYGIAGIVKGLGILSLKQLDIMTKLTQYIQEKKNYKSREGALFAFEMLCTTLGRLFEPYIVHVLPHLLQCFGDSSQYVIINLSSLNSC